MVDSADGTELSLALLRSLVARRRFELSDVAQGYLRWYQGNPRRIGALTRAALDNLRAGEAPEQSGALAWEDSGRAAAGNGSLKRSAALGLLHVRNLDGLGEAAAANSRITHSDPRSVGGCIALATAVALLVRAGVLPRLLTVTSQSGRTGGPWRRINKAAANFPGLNLGLCVPFALGMALAFPDRKVLAPDGEEVCEPLRRDQARDGPPPLQHRVGSHRRPVGNERGGGRSGLLERLPEAEVEALALVVGSRRHLADHPGARVGEDDVGERPSDVDAGSGGQRGPTSRFPSAARGRSPPRGRPRPTRTPR